MLAKTTAPEMASASGHEQRGSSVSVVLEDCVVKSRVSEATIPNVDFVTFFSDAWQKYGDRPALVDAKSGCRCTYGELLDACRRVAAGLRSLGLRPGDVVAFHASTSSELLVAMCGTLFAGGTAALIKANLTEGESRYQFEDAQPKFVFCDGDDIKTSEQACTGVSSVEGFIPLSGDSRGATSLSQLKQHPVDDCEPQAEICTSSVLVIIYSSGTTGLPKGVQLTHRNVIAQAVMYGLLGPSVFDQDDIVLCALPVVHIGGFWVIFSNLGNGCQLVLLHSTDTGVFFSSIERYKPTVLPMYPMFVAKLEEHPLLEHVDTSSVKKLMVGGSSSSASVLQRIAAKLGLKGVIQIYGMTELTCCTAYSTPEMVDLACAGRPAPFVDIKVVEQNTRIALGPYERGELCVKSPGAFKAYLHNPQATADTYENGFVRTGDLGYYTPDGCFFVCGRLKELIKCMDQQVAPAELEKLLSSDPQVRHVVVVGVPHPQYGEAARAYVVPMRPIRQGSAEEQMEAKRLQELVADHLAVHKHLYAGVEFLRNIPRSSNGKDLRSALKEVYMQLQRKS